MSDEQTLDFSRVGRNDLCPCGSGKKFKKCHYLVQRHDKAAAAAPRLLLAHELVDETTTAWELFVLLQQLSSSKRTTEFWSLLHDESELGKKHLEVASFIQEVEQAQVALPVAAGDFFVRGRLDGPDLYLLTGIERPNGTFVGSVVVFRPNQIDGERQLRSVEHQGYRIWSFNRFDISRPIEMSNEDVLSFEDLGLGITWASAWDAPEGWYPEYAIPEELPF